MGINTLNVMSLSFKYKIWYGEENQIDKKKSKKDKFATACKYCKLSTLYTPMFCLSF